LGRRLTSGGMSRNDFSFLGAKTRSMPASGLAALPLPAAAPSVDFLGLAAPNACLQTSARGGAALESIK
jgi:hypothetical protein